MNAFRTSRIDEQFDHPKIRNSCPAFATGTFMQHISDFGPRTGACCDNFVNSLSAANSFTVSIILLFSAPAPDAQQRRAW